MAILRRSASLLLAGAAIAGSIALSAGPALAATTTWTISKGGAVKAAAEKVSLKDSSTGLALTCKGSTLAGKLKSGKKLSGKEAGSLTSFGLTGCSADGFSVKMTTGKLPWHLNLVSYSKGVTTATITGIHLNLSVAAIGCSAIVDGTKATADNGTLAVTYTNKTGKLATAAKGSDLVLYKVTSGCMGVIKSGDKVGLGASYTVTPKQTITGS
jgi:hypothetical protein